MLRQSFKKVQVSQNENPNIISKGKDNTENNDENVTKNNFLQTSTASTTINSNSAQLKRHNQSSAELSVLKSVKRERSTILNVSDSETDESSAEPHMHHNMNEISNISTFSDQHRENQDSDDLQLLQSNEKRKLNANNVLKVLKQESLSKSIFS